MHLRPLRSLSALSLACALLLGLAPSAGAAGAKDKEAQKAYDSAINEDYLNADFAKAEKKLKDAIAKCGSDCSSELLGKMHMALGTVYGVGLSKMDEAKTEFVAALKADPKATLDPSLTTPDLTKAFEEAKKSATSSPKPSEAKPSEAKPSEAKPSDSGHTPPAESPVNTPLPIYVEPSDEVPLSKVTLRYKPFGATQYKSVEMKKLGKGYAVEIPCEDVTTTGDVKYFFAFTGADGEPAGALGSNKDPFKTTVKNELEGDAPRLPGKKPPEPCKEKGDCPPGLPGCEPGKGTGVKRGDKAWGSSCDQTVECKEGLACVNGTCDEDKGGGGGEKPPVEDNKRMNLIGLAAQFDVLDIASAQEVCSGANLSYTCFLPGTSNQFYGHPVVRGNSDGIAGGMAFGGARILLSYERQLIKKLGLTLGLHVGYAFGGPRAPQNQNTTNPNIAEARGFLPFHAEARLSYYVLNSMMEPKKFRPYVFLNGGLAQVNASVSLSLCDSMFAAPEVATPKCGSPAAIERRIDAYQITGLNFLGFGGGTTFGITPLFGVALEVNFMFMVPTFGFVLAPSLGPVVNF